MIVIDSTCSGCRDGDHHVIVEGGRRLARQLSEIDADRALWHRYLGA
jgi:hypothetical protein